MFLFAMELKLDFFASLLFAIVLGVALGALIELILLRPLRTTDIDTTMLVMIGAWIILQNTEQLVWSGVAKSIRSPFPEAPLVIGPVSVSPLRVFVFAAGIVLIIGAQTLINRTKLGRAMRATFQDRDTAALMGVSVSRIYTATFAIGSGLAALGGFILAFAEELGASYISSGYRDAMGFLLIIAVLMLKPTGLFARAERIG
jgi:branched-chain amino acid transport system permease protein